MEDIFHLAITANHTPISKLAAYFQIGLCDFVFLVLLHHALHCSFGTFTLEVAIWKPV